MKDSGALAKGIVIEIVGAPKGFAASVRDALPEATVLRYDEARGATGAAPRVLIVDESAVGDWRSVALMAASAPTLVFTAQPTAAAAGRALDVGVDGYLESSLDASALRGALLGVLRGELAFRREHFGSWLAEKRRAPAWRPTLSPRQQQILELIARGATDKDIAAFFGVRISTAQKQVSGLLRQIGVRNRAAAVAAVRLLI